MRRDKDKTGEPEPVPRKVWVGLGIAVLAVAAAIVFWPRGSAGFGGVLELPEGMEIVDTAEWCRGSAGQCHDVGYVAGPGSEKEVYDALVADLTADGWKANSDKTFDRDGKKVLVRPISEVAASDTDMGRAKARAVAHDPPGRVQVIVFKGLPS